MGASLKWSVRNRRQEDDLPTRGAACVIDPDEIDRSGVASLLRNMGFTTHETEAGATAAFIAEQIQLSVIVINVMLRDVPGLKLLQQLRATAPSAVIVALASSPRAMTLAHAAGADTVLASPCGEALCATINVALGQERLFAPVPKARDLAAPFDAV